MVLINQQYNKVIMGTRDDEYDYLFKGKSLQIFNLLFFVHSHDLFLSHKADSTILITPHIHFDCLWHSPHNKTLIFLLNKDISLKIEVFFWRSRSESKWMMTKYKKIHTYIIYIITLLTIQRDEKKNERRIESLA